MAAQTARTTFEDTPRRIEKPTDVPRRGWWSAAKGVKRSLKDDHVSMLAGATAYFSFLALFPGLVTVISLYGLAASPEDVQAAIEGLSGVVPEAVVSIVDTQLSTLVQSNPSALGWSAIIGFVVALWSASKGTRALIEGITIAYSEEESRGWFKRTALAVGLTLLLVLSAALAVSIVIGLPLFVSRFITAEWLKALTQVGTWAVLGGLGVIVLGIFYRFAPNRAPPSWRWVSPGGVLAVLGFLLVSVGFSLYVSFAGSYSGTYGSLAGVAILLVWLFLSAYLILVGAELNAELEHRAKP